MSTEKLDKQESTDTDFSKYINEKYVPEEPLPPVIRRKKDKNEDDLFLHSLAKSYGVEPKDIAVKIEGYWREYYMNGHRIFRDRA